MNHTFYSTNYHLHTYHRHKYRFTDGRNGASMHYIARMKKGHCRIVSDHLELTVPQGGIFYIPAGLPYRSYWYGDDEIEFDSFGFFDFPEAASSTYALQMLPNTREVNTLMDLIAQDPKICSKTLGYFYALLSALLPNMETEQKGHASHRILQEATSYLAANPRSKISDIARHCNVSESGLYNIFRREANMTPNDLRHKILVDNAVRLLLTTELSIEQISSQLEFSSSSYFRKIFFAHTGKTPRQLRKETQTI